MSDAVRSFLEAAAGIVGPKRLSAQPTDAWVRATEPWPARPLATVHPTEASQVPALLRAASEHGVPVHPVSRGRSWGLGTRLPARDAVVVDLSWLDRILDLDVERGTARIEPGVSFQKLQAALVEAGLSFHVPAYGGPPDASVLANALERGDATGWAGDRFAHLWDLDVALVDGSRFRTGYARFGDERPSERHVRPPGPVLEGLFSQSGLGVVLSGRVGLAPTMPHTAVVDVVIGGPERLAAVLGDVANLIWGGVVDPMGVTLWDPNKLRDADRGDAWSMSILCGGLYEEWLDLRVGTLKATLEGNVESIEALSDVEDGERVPSPLTGFSDGSAIRTLWAAKSSIPDELGDPAAAGCGAIWLCPQLDLSGEALRLLAALVDDAVRGTPVRGAIGAQPVSARALHAFVSLVWDRDVPGADDAAVAAHDRLLARLGEEGMLPYRVGPRTAAGLLLTEEGAGVWRRLQAAFDPQGLLSTGKAPGSR
jgi:4-cresol dehydrogenase (hydroxylating)